MQFTAFVGKEGVLVLFQTVQVDVELVYTANAAAEVGAA
jgi:hypothetical protein